MCTLDGIIDTVSAVHPIIPLIDLLKSHGKLVTVGAPEKPLDLLLPSLIMGKNAYIIFFFIYYLKVLYFLIEFLFNFFVLIG